MSVGVGVGFAVHLVQMVMTLVLNTVDVVKPVVTIWLPPEVTVDVNGQTVVKDEIVSVVTISVPLADGRLKPEPPVGLVPDDTVVGGASLEVAGAELLVRGYGTFEEPDGTREPVPDGEENGAVPDSVLIGAVAEERGAVPDLGGAVPELFEYGAVPELLEYGAVPELFEYGAVPVLLEYGAVPELFEYGAVPELAV